MQPSTTPKQGNQELEIFPCFKWSCKEHEHHSSFDLNASFKVHAKPSLEKAYENHKPKCCFRFTCFLFRRSY